MSDVYIEYMVKRKNTPAILLTKVGIMAAALVAAVAALFFSGFLGAFSMLGSFVAVGACYGGWFLLTAQNIEYEYAVTNGEIDIDKIIAQRRRKRVITVNCREAEAFGRYRAGEHEQREYQKRYYVCDSPDSDGLWYIATRVKDVGQALVVFNANEKMLNGIKPFLPRQIMFEAFKNNE